MNGKGWVFALGPFVALTYLFIVNGGFMHGDCIAIAKASPC